MLNENTPNRAQTPGSEDNSLLKSLLSIQLTSEMLTTEPHAENQGRRRHQEKEDTSGQDSSFDRLVSNFSSIQRQKKDVKRIPEFEEHLKEFSSLVRQFQIKGVVLNQQEIEEFLRDDRKGNDEVDPNVLSKIRSKELESYIRTLGPKTIQMMCDWRDRFHSVHENSNAVLDFSDKKKKVEDNMKLMKKAMENVNAIPPARRDSLSTPVGGSGRRDSLPLINSSPTGSPSAGSGMTLTTTPGTPTSQIRSGMTQSKSSVNMLSPTTTTSYSPIPRASRQRSKSLNVIKKLD
ncbi:predicted protein [Naegleria gruberi]|uniref:Predicted protein n=1 Tax=Naegleria gruberi TaxID=5762 RepID=D2V536_NAEGR|nr:uncharacterized protein NAEGRDRAFT_64001 [Naegleria gruberi]EFC48040.1 predicted protein [Naegleria gruberi]|eukprot:XP_002680784.1 predicted protein [Naegleria gruberi strain NEG-M]